MTPPESVARQRRRERYRHLAGWLDLLGSAVKEATPRIQRAHGQIADGVFHRIERIPQARPAIAVTRILHDRIAGLAYGSVRLGGAGISYLARLHFTQAPQVLEPPRLYSIKPGPGSAEGTGELTP